MVTISLGMVTIVIIVVTIQVTVVTIDLVTSTVRFAEAKLTNRLVEAPKSVCPCVILMWKRFILIWALFLLTYTPNF